MKNFSQHYFKEAVIMPEINTVINPEYKNILSKTKNTAIIINTLKKIMRDVLNNKNTYVEINDTFPGTDGLVGAGYNPKQDYYVMAVTPNIKEILSNPVKSERFYKKMITYLGHENVHKLQNDRANPNRKEVFLNLGKSNQSEEMKRYLGTKKELMAYAYIAAKDLKDVLISKEKILKILRVVYSKKVETIRELIPSLGSYIKAFEHDSDEIKRFLKYIYDYVTIYWEKL